MSDDVIVRATRLDDIESFRACIDRVARARIFVAITEVYPSAEVRAFAEDMVARDLPFYVAADPSGAIVGWCEIQVPKPRPERPGFAHAGTMAMGVDAEWRGRGVGERLLQAALGHAQRIGLERIELQVFADNAAAVALYRKLGFEVEGTKRRARKLDGRYDDLIVMARFLS